MREFLRVPGAFCLALARIVRTVVVVGFGLFALTLLALRFIVLPQVESYRDSVAAALSRELKHPVEIASLTTDWDGWNPRLLIQGFRVLERSGSMALPLVELPEVALIVSWTSVPLLELRLKELIIERPRLAIRRSRAGHLQVAGMEFDPTQTEGGSALADWILQQREIVVRDALITWDDDQRNAPQLVLDRVQFKMENIFGRNRFGLRGTPPAELAAPIDVRGDLGDVSLSDWQRGEGRMFVRLDYADVAAWREWLPLPEQISSGKGAMRVWFRFANGSPREVVADLELRDVNATLGEGLPQLDLDHLSGRAGWRATSSGRELFTQGLAFTTDRGDRLDATNFKLTLRDDPARPAGQMEFDHLQLEPLVAVAAHLPLASRVRADLARFAPRGTLVDGRLRWEGTADDPTTFAATGEFTNLGVTAQDELPGVTGISGRFNVAHDRGEIRVTGNGAVLSLPKVFETPIAFSTLTSAAKWERREGRTAVRIDQFDFANPDATGSATGTYRTTAHGPGEIDITAQVSRVDGRHVYVYLPRVIDDATRRWLRTSLVAGTAADARLKLAGNLTQFPFANGNGGQFLVTAKAKGVTLAYADGWPAIEAIDADLRFEGTRMRIDGTRGRVFGVDIAKARAEIADIVADHPLLTITGEAAGPAAGFVRYVNDSPVGGWLPLPGKAGDADGNGRLGLRLDLPLREIKESKVAGELTLADAQLRIGALPMLTRINGRIAFTENDVRARELTMETLGGPAKLDISSIEGHGAKVSGGGTMTVAALRREQPSEFLDKVSGGTDWALVANLRQGGASSWVVQSSMKGASVDLPAPLGKAAGDAMPLRIERRDDAGQPGTDFISASYGGIAQLAAYRKTDGKTPTIDRALLSLGKAIERPDADRAERPGLWVRAELPALNVDDWVTVLRRTGSAPTSERTVPALAGADLDVGQFDALGVKFADLKLTMRGAPSRWNFVLTGREIAGTADWSAADAGMPNGRLVARLSRLAIPGRSAPSTWRTADVREDATDPKADPAAGNPWPEIDVAADSLLSKERDLGKLELIARPRGSEWRIDRLVLANDSGRLEAEGAWRPLGRAQQTKLDIILDAKDAGGFLATFGYPDMLQGAPTKLDGQLAWAGAPHEFDFPSLSGAFHIGCGPGRFTRIDPGAGGKLLSVLSLQALPRRVSLDFRDVFSEGFTFDEINGNVRITNGVMSTNNLKLAGPAAKIDIAGETDLAKETQRLSVKVQPALSSSVSAGAALLFLANPIVGAAVGAGSLLAQTMMKDPIEKIFSYEYVVTGSWSDPIVVRNASATASAAPHVPAGDATIGITR
ncbi:MAG TPA: YhdP family protein [Casimicrobiaceae bacterium]|nr:YhdP family protein [Casimicrobiaceae bacterium]